MKQFAVAITKVLHQLRSRRDGILGEARRAMVDGQYKALTDKLIAKIATALTYRNHG